MQSTRLRKLGGRYKDEDFEKVVKQLGGRAVLLVLIINKNCDECLKLHNFVNQLKQGAIDKLKNLVVLYGFNKTSLDLNAVERDRERSTKAQKEDDEKNKVSDTSNLYWDKIPNGHGYAIFLSEKNVLYYNDTYTHEELLPNIVDSIRRLNSAVRTIEGLKGKRQFMEKKRTGIIIETSGTTKQEKIIELEQKVATAGKKLHTPVFFCKGLTEEINMIEKGSNTYKLKGLNFDKFLKKTS